MGLGQHWEARNIEAESLLLRPLVGVQGFARAIFVAFHLVFVLLEPDNEM